MKPVVDQLIQAGYTVTRVDCNLDPTALSKYNPTYLPTWITVVDGNEQQRETGLLTYDQLKQWLDSTVKWAHNLGVKP
jgi:thioredoxin-like negative regulator of GroEL